MGTFVMHFEPEDTGHIGMRFRTIEMCPGTHGITGSETAADMHTGKSKYSPQLNMLPKPLLSAAHQHVIYDKPYRVNR